MSLAFYECIFFLFMIKKHPRTSNAAYCPVGNSSTVTPVTRLQAIGFDLFSLYWSLCSAKSVIIILNHLLLVNKQPSNFSQLIISSNIMLKKRAKMKEHGYNNVDAMLVLKDILAHTIQISE